MGTHNMFCCFLGRFFVVFFIYILRNKKILVLSRTVRFGFQETYIVIIKNNSLKCF